MKDVQEVARDPVYNHAIITAKNIAKIIAQTHAVIIVKEAAMEGVKVTVKKHVLAVAQMLAPMLVRSHV